LLFRLPFALWFGIAFSVAVCRTFSKCITSSTCPFGTLNFYLGMCRLSLSTFIPLWFPI
jgi:hypothetical protein